MAREKIDKAVALYFPANIIDKAGRASLVRAKGAACGRCMMAMPDINMCAILDPPRIEMGTVNCGLFVGGKPMPSSKTHQPMRLMPRALAGYYDGPGIPTHCGNCLHFEATSHGEGTCRKVKGIVEEYGCSNQWEEKLELPQPPLVYSP